jgi:hypothetical protein
VGKKIFFFFNNKCLRYYLKFIIENFN